MNEKNGTKEIRELDKAQMETINAGKNNGEPDRGRPAGLTEPRCKYCGEDLKNVGGLNYKCINDDCVNFGVMVHIDSI